MEVDYMMATSLCNIPGGQEQARRRFDWIQAHYSLEPNAAKVIAGAERNCGTVGSQQVSYIWTSATTRTSLVSGAQPSVKGKIYYEWGSSLADGGKSASFIKRIPTEDFESRLIDTTTNGAYAVKMLRKRINSSCARINREAKDSVLDAEASIEASKHFIVVSRGRDYLPSELNIFASRLEKYLQAYCRQFGMTRPQHFIIVYASKNVDNFKKNASLLHGLNLPKGAIGYSFQNDLSIAAVVPIVGVGQGTFNHELFHLLSRSKFGDIPPWMDEGMAALYEVSEIRSTKIAGLPNWRGRVLFTFGSLRPSLKTLLSWNWSNFDNNAEYQPSDTLQVIDNQRFNQQAVNYATARYFMFYLQEKRKLEDVYKAFQERDPDLLTMSIEENSCYTLAQAMGMSFENIESDFQKWLKDEIIKEKMRGYF
ncbi:hypothetical protein [Hymenobacter canadensis]|uniref:Peptidase MA-like domain-containing protein n=1 Tax=Hymenobacter canadensis TaxID=2999067 RepID=A0ABY7LYH9_9BACT|nr:hypothetical protein [Hymenobacter canadensis]WBA44320.1 hypothetical protein O3303_21170 [Hymenobacter canadensis]